MKRLQGQACEQVTLYDLNTFLFGTTLLLCETDVYCRRIEPVISLNMCS